MTSLIYDGSFEGLLTCIYEAYRRHCRPEIVQADKHQEALFGETTFIGTKPEKAQRVVKKLRTISPAVLATVQYCYLSGYPQKGTVILAYIQKALTYGRNVNKMFADPTVSAAQEWAKKVSREAHRFKGLLRFQELQDGSWYAACEPDHCIAPLIAGHCRERFPEQQWIIHDVKRDMAVICRNRNISIYEHTDLLDIQEHLSAQEIQYQTMWKTFFKNISIAERKNPKLQRQWMPKKYWKYLVEKSY